MVIVTSLVKILSVVSLGQIISIKIAGVTMPLFRTHGRISGPISLWDLESRIIREICVSCYI